jgi:hypothetical protein
MSSPHQRPIPASTVHFFALMSVFLAILVLFNMVVCWRYESEDEDGPTTVAADHANESRIHGRYEVSDRVLYYDAIPSMV